MTSNPNASASSTTSQPPSSSSQPLWVIGKHAPVGLHTISAQTASALSTFTFYPFDVLKTRFMSQDGTTARQHNGQTYASIPRSLRVMCQHEGWPALFKGCPVAVIGSTTAWGLYMLMYRSLCNMTEVTSFLGRSGVSMVASIISSLISCPIFLVKSRMQLEEATRPHGHYTSFWRGLSHMVRTTGLRSLWRAASLQMMLVVPNALSVPTYDWFKSVLIRHPWRPGGEEKEMRMLEVGLCSAATKTLILVLSHPLIMLKVRLQDQRSALGEVHYRTVGQSAQIILRNHGVGGLYRGFGTAMVHSLPRALMHYFVYEKTLAMLCRYDKRHTG